MAKRLFRKVLRAPGLLHKVRACFDAIEDPVPGCRFRLSDCLMSGLAVFGLKYPSLLQFDRDARTDEVVRANLKSLYGIERAPCDTALRERLDEVDPRELRTAFTRVFAALQRGKGLEGFTCLDGHYLLSVDGTGYFSSSSVHCKNCCEKHHRDGRVTYYHQMLGAVVVHPEQREVFPLAPEPIVKGDGATKNDCERNAAKRLLGDVRREHPHLKLIVVEDGLASNGPHIKLLKALDMRFILGAKRADHTALFEWKATVPGRAGEGRACALLPGAAACAVCGLSAPGLGDVVPGIGIRASRAGAHPLGHVVKAHAVAGCATSRDFRGTR